MVRPKMDWDRFRNVTNIVLVEQNRISDCIRLLFANFLTLKMSHTGTYRSTTQDIHPMLAVTSITTLLFLCVWCGLYEINKKQQSKCYTWTKSGPKNVPKPNWSDVGPQKSRTKTCRLSLLSTFRVIEHHCPLASTTLHCLITCSELKHECVKAIK